MADPYTNYMGGVRHSPAANVGDSDLFGDNSDTNSWTQARPASDSDVQGTSDLLSGPKRPGKKAPGSMGSLGAVDSPLNVDAHAAIIRASGLGKRATSPEKNQADEDQHFNRDPARPVSTGNPGDFANPHPLTATIRGETPRPTLDDHPNLSYTPMTVGELQQRLGVPSLFGPEA